MVLMAVDHVRVYSGIPAGGPTPGVFFTRWITHFCAPLFIFLAGTAAYLHGQRIGQKPLSRFLLTRGVMLLILELTLIRVSWTFNADFRHYLLAGVIWAIGWSMIVLSGLVRLPGKIIAAFGLAIVFGHNALGGWLWSHQDALVAGPAGWIWQMLYFGGSIHLGGEGGPPLIVLYSLIPWVGVMATGYTFGIVMQMEAGARRRMCLALGLGASALFVVLRFTELYGDYPWRGGDGTMPPVLAFLATNKYPASLLFLLMTLGPSIAIIPWLENARGRVIDWLTVFGRVPLYFYLLHIPLIHLSALAIAAMRTPSQVSWLFENHPMAMGPVPEGYRWSLSLLYLVVFVDVWLLYFLCRRYAQYKAEHPGRLTALL
jgi:uncharacterized membrane protein